MLFKLEAIVTSPLRKTTELYWKTAALRFHLRCLQSFLSCFHFWISCWLVRLLLCLWTKTHALKATIYGNWNFTSESKLIAQVKSNSESLLPDFLLRSALLWNHTRGGLEKISSSCSIRFLALFISISEILSWGGNYSNELQGNF